MSFLQKKVCTHQWGAHPIFLGQDILLSLILLGLEKIFSKFHSSGLTVLLNSLGSSFTDTVGWPYYIYIYIYIYIAKRFSNPRKESTPCDGDGKRK